jgi:prevent-host-death family protein
MRAEASPMPDEHPVMRTVRCVMAPLSRYRSRGKGDRAPEFSTLSAGRRRGPPHEVTIVTLQSESLEGSMARTVKVSEFKAKCLKLLAEVSETGEEIIVTKRGKPLARVVPERNAKPATLQGSMKGLIEILNADKTLPPAWESEAIDGRTARLAANLVPETPEAES